MPRYDAILFDFDGVLLDSEPIHAACWAEVLAPLGVKLPWEEYSARYVGMDDRIMLRQIAAEAVPPLDWQALWGQYPAKKELFRQKIGNPPFPAKLEGLLQQLHSQYPLAVVSSSSRIEIEPPLAARSLRQYFDALVSGEDVECHKPAPDPYLLAARLLGVKEPLVVEDSDPGVASAQAAGFAVLRVKCAAEMTDLLLTCLEG
jgi:HAD superfamily hydrolase (TIGR01509 family)